MPFPKNGENGYIQEQQFMNKNLLLIFTRNPSLGKVKTRLAKTIGDEKALEIYTFLLQRTKSVTELLPCDKAVYYSVKVRENDLWPEEFYQKYPQQGNDLGERMEGAFENGFNKGYQKVMIIGSDLYDITPAIINEAFDTLDSHDVVIGPAEDGGYYLLGMKSRIPALFKAKKWGTASVLQDSLDSIRTKKVHLLTTLNDIDVYEDIERHPAFQQFL